MVRVSRRVGRATALLSRRTPFEPRPPRRTPAHHPEARTRRAPGGDQGGRTSRRPSGCPSDGSQAVSAKPDVTPSTEAPSYLPTAPSSQPPSGRGPPRARSAPPASKRPSHPQVRAEALPPEDDSPRPQADESLRGTTRGPDRLLLERFHVLLNSLFKVLFNVPSRYLFSIGLAMVFSLRWSLPPALGCILKQPDS